ncbi:thioredoxin domain-containing protein [Desulforhopalus singaporensis]|uniref:Uncharacterized membrane protein n=1 Tax=Desulforhopalus singaporensis TaxID=91360 RepID=A0A1H0RUP3_9BACT|nr:hypothetical protein [Desulforhopalus singaporensis]SDP33177.1 Uncharacterized membrane protein [Desulforhopalus singaporensis]
MLSIFLALLATLVTGAQALFIYLEGSGFCLYNGCEIVESMALVSPLIFNLAGFAFFVLLFFLFSMGRNGSSWRPYWQRFAGLLLLAGLVAEAVLVYFQYAVAGLFCSYCTVILALVVLLNLCCGPRQVFRGIILFSSVLLACFSLGMGGATVQKTLGEGTLAAVEGNQKQDMELYLFFAKNCKYCEKVIASLEQQNRCSIAFNPIEKIDDFQFAGSRLNDRYDPGVNIEFMYQLDLSTIPVLLVKDGQQRLLINGGDRIVQFLNENCFQPAVEQSAGYGGVSSAEPLSYETLLSGGTPDDDSCQITEVCPPEDEAPLPVQQ